MLFWLEYLVQCCITEPRNATERAEFFENRAEKEFFFSFVSSLSVGEKEMKKLYEAVKPFIMPFISQEEESFSENTSLIVISFKIYSLNFPKLKRYPIVKPIGEKLQILLAPSFSIIFLYLLGLTPSDAESLNNGI